MKFTYNERRKNKADDERRKSGKDRAERNVSEYVEKGKFVIHVGAASNDIRLSKEIVMHWPETKNIKFTGDHYEWSNASINF